MCLLKKKGNERLEKEEVQLTMAGGVGSVKRISVDALACVCIYTQD
jgi:hypothetical protein